MRKGSLRCLSTTLLPPLHTFGLHSPKGGTWMALAGPSCNKRNPVRMWCMPELNIGVRRWLTQSATAMRQRSGGPSVRGLNRVPPSHQAHSLAPRPSFPSLPCATA